MRNFKTIAKNVTISFAVLPALFKSRSQSYNASVTVVG
jgi:hypothetical protein